MIKAKSIVCLIAALLLVAPLIGLSQDANQKGFLIINGQPDHVPLIQVNGRRYVDLESLTHVTNGTLSYSGNHITLNLPGPGANASNSFLNQGFSKEFLRAGIEEMGTLREWHTALASAIQIIFL